LTSFEAELVGLKFDFNYDADQLFFKGIEIGPAAQSANKALTHDSQFPGRLRVVIQGLDRDVILNGEVAVLRFDLSPGAPTSPIALILTNAFAFGANAAPIPLELNPGLLLVELAEFPLPTWTPSVTDTPTAEPTLPPTPPPDDAPPESAPQSFQLAGIELSEWLPPEVIELLNQDPNTAEILLGAVVLSGVFLLLGLLLNLTDRRR
jgi:hypothetical protein